MENLFYQLDLPAIFDDINKVTSEKCAVADTNAILILY